MPSDSYLSLTWNLHNLKKVKQCSQGSMVWPNLTYSHLLADSVYIHSSVKIIMKKKKNNKKKNRKQVWYKYDLTWKFVNRYIYIYIVWIDCIHKRDSTVNFRNLSAIRKKIFFKWVVCTMMLQKIFLQRGEEGGKERKMDERHYCWWTGS